MIKNENTEVITSSSNTEQEQDAGQQDSNIANTEKSSGNDSAYQGDNEQDDDDDGKSVKPKGKLTTTEHGIVKRPKKVRKFKCKICDCIFGSTKLWNRHYEETHPQIPCDDCGKMFRNPTSLYRHRYTHTKVEEIYPCTKCERVFPFSSQLSSHMFSHRKVSHFPCTHSGCKKTFKTKWNRNAHERGHKSEVMQCPYCNYSTKDLRYMKQHSQVHEDTYKYHCEKCNKGFKFYEQIKRHRTKVCMKASNSDEF